MVKNIEDKIKEKEKFQEKNTNREVLAFT
jgi:hypothetical protein